MDQVSPGLDDWGPFSGKSRYPLPNKLCQMGARGFVTGPEWRSVKLVTPVSLVPKFRIKKYLLSLILCLHKKELRHKDLFHIVVTKSWPCKI
jgi:hypothetical protein